MTAVPARPAHVPLAVATRADHVESVHFGSVAVVDADGRLLDGAGDPQAIVFTRSALKPLQALPFVRDGGPQRFGFTEPQVALMCASHSGEPMHVAQVSEMLARAGNRVDDLGCGTHAPGHYEVRGEVPPRPPYSPLAHNCSGKHAGMLAACTLHGHDKRDYLAFDHPVQRAIRDAVASVAAVDATTMPWGIDGCSAPNYALPLASLAYAYARLAAGDPADAPLRLLRDAMRAHPAMVSGTGRSDETLMRAGAGDWVAKIGAEGVQAFGATRRGLGIAVKIADGSRRALLPVLVSVLEQLRLVDGQQSDALERLRRATLANYRGTPTGSIVPVVRLDGRAASGETLR